MARKPAPTKAHEPEASPADQAFGAARAFVEHLAMVAQFAREYRPHPDKPDAWQDVAFHFAGAFIAWYDLTHLLTPAVCTEARRVYPSGAASIKLGAGSGAAPVVPAMPASVVNLLTPFRRVELDATPYPTVIEAVAGGLGVYFRNAVYTGRRHPLEPDTERVADEAKARATARQVAQGKPAEPFGWGADYDELMKQETRAAVRARLGIKTYGDGQDLMMREWKAQDRARGESALYLLRCDPINFPDLRMQLIREAEAVIAAASKPNAPAIDPATLAAAVVKAMESRGAPADDDAPAAKLPTLKPWAMEAWKARQVGMTVTAIAATLADKYNDPRITQPRVSEQIQRAMLHAEASGLAVDAARVLPQVGSRAPARTLDPAAAELGKRTDGKAHHLRERERQKAQDGDDDE